VVVEQEQEQAAAPAPVGRPWWRQQRGAAATASRSWKPCSLDKPQAEHLEAPVGLWRVHLEQAQVLKSGLEGLAGVKRTTSQPTRSMRSAPACELRHASHLDAPPGLGSAQLGHFQVEAEEADEEEEEEGGRWGVVGWWW